MPVRWVSLDKRHGNVPFALADIISFWPPKNTTKSMLTSLPHPYNHLKRRMSSSDEGISLLNQCPSVKEIEIKFHQI